MINYILWHLNAKCSWIKASCRKVEILISYQVVFKVVNKNNHSSTKYHHKTYSFMNRFLDIGLSMQVDEIAIYFTTIMILTWYNFFVFVCLEQAEVNTTRKLWEILISLNSLLSANGRTLCTCLSRCKVSLWETRIILFSLEQFDHLWISH